MCQLTRPRLLNVPPTPRFVNLTVKYLQNHFPALRNRWPAGVSALSEERATEPKWARREPFPLSDGLDMLLSASMFAALRARESRPQKGGRSKNAYQIGARFGLGAIARKWRMRQAAAPGNRVCGAVMADRAKGNMTGAQRASIRPRPLPAHRGPRGKRAPGGA
jgi:hypothetical protein